MKLRNFSLLMFSIVVAIITVFSLPAMATDVGGIIDTDTTWDLAGSPYNFISNTQIATGITLTIEPGVIIYGANQALEVFGILQSIGQDNAIIKINNLEIVTNTDGAFNISFSEIVSGPILLGSAGHGTLNITDSIIRDSSYINLHSTGGDCYIQRNVFISAATIYVGTGQSHDLYITNNVFYEQTYKGNDIHAIEDSGNSGQTIVQYNSFLSTDKIALGLSPNRPLAQMVPVNNFWNTTDIAIIDSMIYDRNDDLNVSNYIEYIPILTGQHPDTPALPVNQAPTSEAGLDRVFFDEVTLDGSASYDPDGTIVSYDWSLQHRTNPDNDKTATGVNPTVTGLNNGFYDVCLTVTDDLGATDIDCALLAAAGSCFCSPATVHIEMIEPNLLKADKGKRYGQALVKVVDDCGNAVSGVTVYGTFSGGFSESINGQTAGDGNVLLTTITSAKGQPVFTFCVDDVINGALSYAPADNVETCDSSQ